MNISATVSYNTSSTGGGNGGFIIPTSIIFSGKAYPSSIVYILKDGFIVSKVELDDKTSNFSFSLFNLNTNNYNFSIYAKDKDGNKSSIFYIPIYVQKGINIDVSNVVLSPTINLDKDFVNKGDNLIISGRGLPNSKILISLDQNGINNYYTFSDNQGYYSYNLNTSNLNIGNYLLRAKTSSDLIESPYTLYTVFSVGLNKLPVCLGLLGDLNCDHSINFIDFSIMKYWYYKSNFPLKVDLNSDNVIDMKDFSILAFNWTE